MIAITETLSVALIISRKSEQVDVVLLLNSRHCADKYMMWHIIFLQVNSDYKYFIYLLMSIKISNKIVLISIS